MWDGAGEGSLAEREFHIGQPGNAVGSIRCSTCELPAHPPTTNFKMIVGSEYASFLMAWSHFRHLKAQAGDGKRTPGWKIEDPHIRDIGRIDERSTNPLRSSLRAGAE